MTISLLRHPRCSYRTTTPRPLLYPKLAALSFRALLFSSSVVQTQLDLSHNERVSQKSLETSGLRRSRRSFPPLDDPALLTPIEKVGPDPRVGVRVSSSIIGDSKDAALFLLLLTQRS